MQHRSCYGISTKEGIDSTFIFQKKSTSISQAMPMAISFARQDLRERITHMEQTFNQRFVNLEQSLNQRISETNQRIDKLYLLIIGTLVRSIGSLITAVIAIVIHK